MILTHPKSVEYVFVVCQDTKPLCGEYIDPRGHFWYVRNVKEDNDLILTDPGPTRWKIQVTPENPSYTICYNDKLQMIFNPYEIGIRREKLRALLINKVGFKYVGVSNDGISLEANFNTVLSKHDLKEINDIDIDGMPVIVKYIED
jgi:hypothetical protein